MGYAAKIAAIGDQKLTAPDRAVRTVPGPVERHADHRFVQSVFSHDRSDMRMVMLYADLWQRQLSGIFGRPIFRMQVVSHDLRLDIKEGFVILNGICIVLIGR